MLTFRPEKNLDPDYYEVICDFFHSEGRVIGHINVDSSKPEFVHDDEQRMSLDTDEMRQILEFMESFGV